MTIKKYEENFKVQSWGKTRYFILVFVCFIGYGCYFNIDLPSALQDKIEGKYDRNCTLENVNETCCEDCLGLDSERYNLLYAVFLWLTAASALPAGIIIDRISNRVAALVSTFTCALGTVCFSVSLLPGIRHSGAMFPLMVLGRVLLGAGVSSIRIVQNRIIAFWFPDRMELVFGLIVCVVCMGNVSNFLLTANISEWLNLQMATWTGTLLGAVGFVAAVFLAIFDRIGSKEVKVYEEHDAASLRILDARKFPFTYWLVVVMIVFFYSAYVPFIANGCEYIEQNFKFSGTISSYINGASYDVAVVACPVVGILLNRYVRRYTVATLGSAILIPLYLVLLLYPVTPIAITIIFGMAYSMVAVSIWPSIAKTVPLKYVGTANGIASTLNASANGLSCILVGKLLEGNHSADKYRTSSWNSVFLYLISLSVVSFFCGIALIWTNKQKRKLSEVEENVSSSSPNIQNTPNETQGLLNNSSDYGSVT